MSCYDYVVNLVVPQEGTRLTKFSSDKEAKSSSYYACSGTEYQVEGANVFVIG